MEPIFTEMTVLEILAEKIHTHQPVGRMLAVTLDHVAHGRGYFENQSILIQEHINALYNAGEGKLAHELEKAYAAAMVGGESFETHANNIFDEWVEETLPE